MNKVIKLKLRPITFAILVFLLLALMPFRWAVQVYADDALQQPAQERKVVDPNLEEILADMSPTDNISVIVLLRMDPKLDQQIQDIWEDQPDDELNRIEESLKQKYREVSKAMGPLEEQLMAHDPAAVEKYNQLIIEYGLTGDDLKPINQGIEDLKTAKRRQVNSLLEQAYSDMQNQAKERIEELPDTIVVSSHFILNNLVVETKVGNIQAIAAISDVVRIAYDAPVFLEGQPSGVNLAYPVNGFIGCPVEHLIFSWLPFEDTKKYKFILSKDGNMWQIIKEAEVSGTSYQYDGTLDYGTPYFWRVQCIEPACDSSPIFSFMTEEAPPPSSEASPQSTPWSPVLIVGLATALAAGIGLATWFFVARKPKAK